MAVADLYNIKKEKIREINVDDEIFSAEIRPHLYYDVIKWQLACRRKGTACTKDRSQVAYSTRKLYRQKGTGRARRGSRKSPLLKGGGVVFGPKPKDFSYNLPKKVRKGALCSALSQKMKEGKILFLDEILLEIPKTKQIIKFMGLFEIKNALFIDRDNRPLSLSCRNLSNAKMLDVQGLNLYDLLKYDTLVLTLNALQTITGVLKK